MQASLYCCSYTLSLRRIRLFRIICFRYTKRLVRSDSTDCRYCLCVLRLTLFHPYPKLRNYTLPNCCPSNGSPRPFNILLSTPKNAALNNFFVQGGRLCRDTNYFILLSILSLNISSNSSIVPCFIKSFCNTQPINL